MNVRVLGDFVKRKLGRFYVRMVCLSCAQEYIAQVTIAIYRFL